MAGTRNGRKVRYLTYFHRTVIAWSFILSPLLLPCQFVKACSSAHQIAIKVTNAHHDTLRNLLNVPNTVVRATLRWSILPASRLVQMVFGREAQLKYRQLGHKNQIARGNEQYMWLGRIEVLPVVATTNCASTIYREQSREKSLSRAWSLEISPSTEQCQEWSLERYP